VLTFWNNLHQFHSISKENKLKQLAVKKPIRLTGIAKTLAEFSYSVYALWFECSQKLNAIQCLAIEAITDEDIP